MSSASDQDSPPGTFDSRVSSLACPKGDASAAGRKRADHPIEEGAVGRYARESSSTIIGARLDGRLPQRRAKSELPRRFRSSTTQWTSSRRRRSRGAARECAHAPRSCSGAREEVDHRQAPLVPFQHVVAPVLAGLVRLGDEAQQVVSDLQNGSRERSEAQEVLWAERKAGR